MRFLVSLFLVGNLLAEVLSQVDGASLTQTSDCSFIIKTDLKIDSFALKEPNRFVVDIIGAKIKRNSSMILKTDCVIGVRVGTHPQFVRFVFDLNKDIQGELKNNQITFSSTSTPLISTSTISPTNAPVSTSTPIPTSTPPTKLPILESTPTNTAKAEEPTIVSEPTITPAPTIPPNPTPTSPAPPEPTTSNLGLKEKALTRIEFLAHGARVTFSSEISFKQTRAGPEMFRIFISGASLGSEKVNHPFFAPQDIPGIISIVPSESSDGVTLEITVERNTQIFAYRDGKNLEIRKG